jgi:hypothetical protein
VCFGTVVPKVNSNKRLVTSLLPDGKRRSGRMGKQFNRRLFFAVAHELGEHGRCRRVRRAKRRGGALMRTSKYQESGLGRGAGEYRCSEWAWWQIAPGISSSSTPVASHRARARTGGPAEGVEGKGERRRGRERQSPGLYFGCRHVPSRTVVVRIARNAHHHPGQKGDTWLRQRRERVRTGF